MLPEVGIESANLSQQLRCCAGPGCHHRKEGSAVFYSLTSPTSRSLLAVAASPHRGALRPNELLEDLQTPVALARRCVHRTRRAAGPGGT